MKNSLIVLTATVALIAAGCGQSRKAEESATATDSTDVAPKKEGMPRVTICLWNEVGIRDNAGEKAKYLTTIYLGEKLTFLGDTASELSGKKKINYKKIRMTDGQEGWVRDEFIAVDVLPAVFKSEALIYKRPEMATATDKSFNKMDVVAIKSIKDNWAEVIGKRTGDPWFTSGYVRHENLTNGEKDLEFAALYRRAIETKDPDRSKQSLQRLQATDELRSSSFYSYVFDNADAAADSIK